MKDKIVGFLLFIFGFSLGILCVYFLGGVYIVRVILLAFGIVAGIILMVVGVLKVLE